MADVSKLVDELSSLTVLEAAELARLLQPPKNGGISKAKVINFYMDESGTRHPDHGPGKWAQHGYDWFALGGVLVRDADEIDARRLHAELCKKWNLDVVPVV